MQMYAVCKCNYPTCAEWDWNMYLHLDPISKQSPFMDRKIFWTRPIRR